MLEVMRHAHIIQIKEFYRTRSKKLVMILEFARGGDLQQRVDSMIQQGDSFSESTILSKSRRGQKHLTSDWMLQLLEALEYIHTSKLLHRDIKTANIFLDEHSQIKLGDFGTATLKKVDRTISSDGS